MEPTAPQAPEPEFLIGFFLTGFIFVVGALVAFWLFSVGRRRGSVVLRCLAVFPLAGGTLVFAPMAYLAFLWVVFWLTHRA